MSATHAEPVVPLPLWRTMVRADLLCKGLAFIALTPALSLLLHGFLALTGRGVLTDLELARVLLHPLGWVAIVTVSTAALAIAALEHATLLSLAVSHAHGQPLTVVASLWFVLGHAVGILRIAARMVLRLIALALPFLLAGCGLYYWLVSDHDINYYLTEQPPKFWWAVAGIGGVLVMGGIVLLGQIAGWSAALPLHLLERIAPGQCLAVSRQRLRGRRGTITVWLIIWLALNLLLSAAFTAVVGGLGEHFVPRFSGELWRLVLVLGGVLTLWSLLNLIASLVAAITFSLLLARVYDRWGRSAACLLPDHPTRHPRWSLRWTTGRLTALMAIGLAAAALMGVLTIQSLPVADSVQVAAHRGGGGTAPENSLAAIRQAIEHGTDWIEIDVQESSDGEVLVVHDADLQKVARFPGKIWETTAADLRAVDIGSYVDARFSSERVPTLAEVLDECRGRAKVLIELKYYGHDQHLEARVVNLVEAHGMSDAVAIMSMNPRGLAKVRALRPQWRIGLVTAVAAGDLTRADADFLAVNTRIATEPFVQLAHRRGKDVCVWTINDRRAMTTLISRGIDVLITDYPELARQVLQERAALSSGERLLLELAVLFDRVPTTGAP